MLSLRNQVLRQDGVNSVVYFLKIQLAVKLKL